MMEQQEQDNQRNRSAFSYNNEVNQQPTIVQLRLEVRQILDYLEYFLRGYRIVTKKDETGQIVEVPEFTGERKANDIGIQNIMLRINAIVNPATVQSNYELDDLNSYLMNVEISISRMIMVSCYKWEIKVEQQDTIVDFIMELIEPFMKRTIDNQERILLGSSTRVIERSGLDNQKTPTNWFKLVKS
jgi:hypothetical protein